MNNCVNKEKWVLITGALGGIGQALVNEYSQVGYKVIATDVQSLNEKIKLDESVHFLQSDLAAVAYDEKLDRVDRFAA